MKFEDLVALTRDVPVFHSGLLLAGDVKPDEVQRQLVRWTAARRVVQLRRGLYVLAPPYRHARLEPFVIANQLLAPSYVSCQSALAFHGLIPEAVPVVVSVTTRRTAQRTTPLGTYRYHHVRRAAFRGYARVPLAPPEFAFVATAEKALLDLVHLEPGADRTPFLAGLRLQNLSSLDPARLREEAEASGSPKLRRAARRIERMARRQQQEMTEL